jgi:hypothetical protein
MMVVQIEKPANMTLAMWFTELRIWLDENNCHPSSFLPSDGVTDKVAFDVTFDTDSDYRLFVSKFASEVLPI